MASGALFALTFGVLLFGAVMGLVSGLIGRSASLPPAVGFGWGAVFGPIGIIVVTVLVIQRRQHAREMSGYNS